MGKGLGREALWDISMLPAFALPVFAITLLAQGKVTVPDSTPEPMVTEESRRSNFNVV